MDLVLTPTVAERPLLDKRFGADIIPSGVIFRLWAPLVDRVGLKLSDRPEPLPMRRSAEGLFTLEVEGTGHGTRYGFVLPDGTVVPDPASRFQPDDVHGLSEVVDPARFEWTDHNWRGRPWEETVLYELHLGTFTDEGTYRAAIGRLDHLVSLGVTAIEIMPVADFAGRWNWGYDGAMLYAPDSSYGRPEDLKALVDAAHARSLSVFLDVVYNHFGPSGNYLPAYAPLFTEKHRTPWGPAVNYDDTGSDGVRELVIGNACYWADEFHVDGFRFDAVHEIRDNGERHILAEIVQAVRARTTDRPIHLVLENSANWAHWLRRAPSGEPLLYTAQWNDDLHHCLHAAATGEATGYYGDYAGRIDLLGRALAQGYAYQGEIVPSTGAPRGEPSGSLPPSALVSFAQNHDHIGNRAFGDRLTTLVPNRITRALAAVYLLAPQIPLLFMGEEWGATQPFLFFSDIAELGDVIRRSRVEEFKAFYDQAGSALPPDPMSEETFRASKLDWSDLELPEHADWLGLYRTLLGIRRAEIAPRLRGMGSHSGRYEILGDKAVRVHWTMGDGAELTLIANLSGEALDDVDCWGSGRHLWLEGHASGNTLEAWSVVWSLKATPG